MRRIRATLAFMRLPLDGSPRARAAAVAALVTALALILVGGLVVAAVRASVTGDVEAAAREHAAAVARFAAADNLGGLGEPAATTRDFVQVTTPDGRVLYASGNLAGRGPVADFPARTDTGTVRTVQVIYGGADPSTGDLRRVVTYRVAARQVHAASGTATVYAGTSLAQVRRTSKAALWVMLPGLPVLVLLSAALTAWLTAPSRPRGPGAGKEPRVPAAAP